MALQVRLAFLGMVGSWLLTLRERLDHQPRLLPYLLSGLCDESPVVVQVRWPEGLGGACSLQLSPSIGVFFCCRLGSQHLLFILLFVPPTWYITSAPYRPCVLQPVVLPLSTCVVM